ncbi:protein phosphatase 1, regulatory (inhibitor) subunit 14Aa [Esox lucius]|uniref:Protein phosphatase 1 regulatory subunit 14A n=1 Tax=Esox lucius TaxID=8010 RepID=A0AAY5KB21_ESOLU|nr:protein phosphatase 1, regulatory (inhibitor) subunit 14Aa [Esox lucius]
MAADRVGWTPADKVNLSNLETSREHGVNLKRQTRVTVKYNRKELQKRLDVEKWIDHCLDELYLGKEDDMPDEVNIDDLLDLPSNEERVKSLQVILQACNNSTEAFISELLVKLEGLHKQEDLASEGLEHPSLCNHPQHRHEPYHFNDPHCPRAPNRNHTHQTL